MIQKLSGVAAGDEIKHTAGIIGNWDLLAPEAYRGYLAHGRGALAILWSSGGRMYVPAEIVRQSRGADPDLPGTMEVLRTYDPETTVVCILVFDAGDIAAYAVTAPTPDLAPTVLYGRSSPTPSA